MIWDIGKEIVIFRRANNSDIDRIFSEVSITAKPFFEKQRFIVLSEQTILRKGVELTNYKMEKRLILKEDL